MAEQKRTIRGFAHIFVVSDMLGFVGVYTSLEGASTVVRKHAPTPFLVHRYDADPGGSQETAWMVIYRANEGVAFASNNKAVAVDVQSRYAALGLVYEDDISHWEFPLDKIHNNASMRLEAIKALTKLNEMDTEYEKLSILTDVVCIPSRAEVPVTCSEGASLASERLSTGSS
jgi:hypothetical protein